MESSKSRKRKSPKGAQIFEVSEKDLSSDCSEEESPEPDAKVQKTRNSDVAESRVSSGPNLKIQQKLADIKKTFQNTGDKQTEEKIGKAHVEHSNIVETPVKDKTKKLKPKKVIKNKKQQKKQSPTKNNKSNAQEKGKQIDKLNCPLGPPESLPIAIDVTGVSGNIEDGEVSDTQDKILKSEESPDSSNLPTQSDISISFKSKLISDTYKQKLLRYLERFVELNIETPSDTTMHISVDPSLDPAEWHVVDTESIAEIQTTPEKQKPKLELDLTLCQNEEVDTTSKKKKKRNDKKKNKKSNKDSFIVDATPTPEVQSNTNPQYFTRFLINDSKGEEADDLRLAPASMCFNCEKSHSLKDCPEPKNMAKINANRQKFMNNKSNKTMGRYHVEEDQKFGHLVPGKISVALRKALGLKKNQIPRIFYQMRLSGYPPGWLEMAKIEQSDLTMFDIHGNDVKNANLKALRGLDPDKIIEYPGFNAPFEKGAKDEFKTYRVPPYSEECSKQNMIEYFEKEFRKELDDFKTQDMEIEEKCSEKTDGENIEQKKEVLTLKDLEKEKETLLKKLNNEDSNSRSSDELKVELEQDKDGKPGSLAKTNDDFMKDSSTSNKIDLTNDDETKINDQIDLTEDDKEKVDTELEIKVESKSEIIIVAETTEDCNLSIRAESSSNTSTTRTPTTNKIKDSTFGTPILKSASPYNVLPNQDNFSRDISPVINFENLPNSTGKYEKMTGVLQKVRNTLKHLSQCKS